MKTMNIYQIITLTLTTILAFIGSYLFKITADNIEQYLAVCLVLFADGFFGIWAGTKHYGFQTKKALKIPKTLAFWIILLTIILSIEKGFTGTSWLSETIVAPKNWCPRVCMCSTDKKDSIVKWINALNGKKHG
jgi:hypothetical protein